MTHPLDTLVREEQLAIGKYDVPRYDGVRARMDANEYPYPLEPDVAAELGDALAKVSANRYPDSEAAEVRGLVSADLGVAPDQLVFGNGSQDLVMLVMAAFARPRPGVADGRARVLYPVPTFVGYALAANMLGAVPVEVPLRDDFELDEAAIERGLATTRPNLALFALPNNPTGTLWPRAAIERVLANHPDVIVVADEAYVEYAGETLLDLLPSHPNLLILRTLSKLGLAAVRLGYLVGAPDVVSHVEKIRPPYNVGALNQAAAAWLLAHHLPQLRARVAVVIRERERLVRELAMIRDVHVFPSRSNHILCRYGVAGDGRAARLCGELAKLGILVRNFDTTGPLSGCFRVTVGSSEENTLFLDAMTAVIRVEVGECAQIPSTEYRTSQTDSRVNNR